MYIIVDETLYIVKDIKSLETGVYSIATCAQWPPYWTAQL